jgi:hypothetical protein
MPETNGLSGYGDVVKIHHVHVPSQTAEDFITLDINIDKSIQWSATSTDRWTQISLFLHGENRETLLQEIIGIAYESARGCKENTRGNNND